MTPNPQTPEAAAARDKGYALTRSLLATMDTDLDAVRKAVGAARASYLAQGDWEGVWQASGSLDAIREAQKEARS